MDLATTLQVGEADDTLSFPFIALVAGFFGNSRVLHTTTTSYILNQTLAYLMLCTTNGNPTKYSCIAGAVVQYGSCTHYW